MSELITFEEHPVKNAEAQVLFSPPYLLKDSFYKLIFGFLNDCVFSVASIWRNDLEMT